MKETSLSSWRCCQAMLNSLRLTFASMLLLIDIKTDPTSGSHWSLDNLSWQRLPKHFLIQTCLDSFHVYLIAKNCYILFTSASLWVYVRWDVRRCSASSGTIILTISRRVWWPLFSHLWQQRTSLFRLMCLWQPNIGCDFEHLALVTALYATRTLLDSISLKLDISLDTKCQ